MGDNEQEAAPSSSQVSLRDQLFGSQDPNSSSGGGLKAAMEKCPGCLELQLWRTASRKTFEGIYDAASPAASGSSPSGSSAATEAAASVMKTASSSRTFVPEKRHLARCPKKPKRSSHRQANAAAWTDVCSEFDERQWANMSGRSRQFFDVLGQHAAHNKFQKRKKQMDDRLEKLWTRVEALRAVGSPEADALHQLIIAQFGKKAGRALEQDE